MITSSSVDATVIADTLGASGRDRDRPDRDRVVRPISDGVRRWRRGRADASFDEVLTSARAGFPWAFEHLFRALGRPLVGYFRAQGVADPDGSANDVLLRAFGRIDSFEGNEAQFRAWVFTIARNCLIDERRRNGRRVETQPLENSHERMVVVAGSDERAIATLGHQRVTELIDALVPDQREVLFLRIIGDLTIEQIAEVVGKRPGAVKALQRRGLAAIRRNLERAGVPL